MAEALTAIDASVLADTSASFRVAVRLLVLLPILAQPPAGTDLTPDWDAFYAYWVPKRAEAERESREAGDKAFKDQQAAAWVLLDAAAAERALVRQVRKAEAKALRHEASIEHRRRYNAAWMRDYRARKKAARLVLEVHQP